MNRTRKLYRTMMVLAGGAICLQFGACSAGSMIAQIVLPLAFQLASEILTAYLSSITVATEVVASETAATAV